MVLIAHGVDQRNADRVWGICVAMSAIVAGAIIAGMSGVRIGALVSRLENVIIAVAYAVLRKARESPTWVARGHFSFLV